MAKIQRTGNSIGVPINKVYLEVAGFEIGTEVIIDARKGKIIITRKEDKK